MEKVFVSGGSGFIALHLISKLIQEGYKVRTSLRSLDRKQEVIDAVEKEVSTAGMLEFCELDLLKDGNFIFGALKPFSLSTLAISGKNI